MVGSDHDLLQTEVERHLLRSIVERRETCGQAAEALMRAGLVGPGHPGDLDMLQRLANKAVEPLMLGDVGHQDKTIGAWRQEMADVLSELIFYMARRSRG